MDLSIILSSSIHISSIDHDSLKGLTWAVLRRIHMGTTREPTSKSIYLPALNDDHDLFIPQHSNCMPSLSQVIELINWTAQFVAAPSTYHSNAGRSAECLELCASLGRPHKLCYYVSTRTYKESWHLISVTHSPAAYKISPKFSNQDILHFHKHHSTWTCTFLTWRI